MAVENGVPGGYDKKMDEKQIEARLEQLEKRDRLIAEILPYLKEEQSHDRAIQFFDKHIALGHRPKVSVHLKGNGAYLLCPGCGEYDKIPE